MNITDSFTRSNESPLTTPWITGEWYSDADRRYVDLVSNATQNRAGGQAGHFATYVGTTFAPNQSSEIYATPTSYNADAGPTVRHGGVSHRDFYVVWVTSAGPTNTARQFYRSAAAGWTALGSSGSCGDYPQTIKLSVKGNRLDAYVGGVHQGQQVDSTYKTGQPGFGMAATTATHMMVDNWVGTDTAGVSRARIVNCFGFGGTARSSVVNSGGQ